MFKLARSLASKPAIQLRGPAVSKVQAEGKRPHVLTSPYVGFKPYTPHIVAGERKDLEKVKVAVKHVHSPFYYLHYRG